jgi:hypothetical protein
MRAIGLSFQKGRIRATVLEQANGSIVFQLARAITVDPELSLPDLMDRYATQVRLLIEEFAPDVVAVRQVWDSKNMVAAMCQVAPTGIAAYVCHQMNVTFRAYTPQALRQPKPFGLNKGVKPIDAVNEKFGEHPPHWDEMQKTSLLVAWRALLDDI